MIYNIQLLELRLIRRGIVLRLMKQRSPVTTREQGEKTVSQLSLDTCKLYTRLSLKHHNQDFKARAKIPYVSNRESLTSVKLLLCACRI